MLKSFSGAAGLAVEEGIAGRSKDDFSLDSPFIEQFIQALGRQIDQGRQSVIRLVGPGGAGKTTTGVALALRLGTEFVDLDQRFAAAFGDISEFLSVHDYATYVTKNIEVYATVMGSAANASVLALSSGFMTYAEDVHPSYATLCRGIAASATTIVLMPSLDYETCVAETVRRQLGRSFSRSAHEEEQVIRDRFPIYRGLSAEKVETMQSVVEVVEAVIAALLPNKALQLTS